MSTRLNFESCNGLHDWERIHKNNPSSQFGKCKVCLISQNNIFEPKTKCTTCNDVAYFYLSIDAKSKDESYCSNHYFETLSKIISLDKDKEFNSTNCDYDAKS